MINEQEGFYEPNVIIRDNWVYNHGNKGIEVALAAVKMLQLKEQLETNKKAK